MTAIAGIIDNGRVHLAGDSAVTRGWGLALKPSGKLFRHGPYVIGVSGSLRAAQLLQHAFTPSEPPAGKQLAGFMATAFVDGMRSALKDGGHATATNSEEAAVITMLVGVHGRLFKVCGDYGVCEGSEPFDAVGCGEEFALGALHATEGLGWKPRKRLRAALEAAERFSAGVRAPFTFAATPKAGAA